MMDPWPGARTHDHRHPQSPVSDLITAMSGWRGLLLVLGLALAWHALRGLAWERGLATFDRARPLRTPAPAGTQPGDVAAHGRPLVAALKNAGLTGRAVYRLRVSLCRQRGQLPHSRPTFRRRTAVSVSSAPTAGNPAAFRDDIGRHRPNS